MQEHGTRPRWTARIAAAAVVVLCSLPSPVDACGGFFSRAAIEGQRRPSLAYEQTLIVFDAEKRREHFVREVVFERAREPFGFVVPAPARPEVAAVEKTPFADLRASYPFEPTKGGLRAATAGGGLGSGIGTPGGVQVLDVKKVGSFTAFVLAASDATALAAWLTKNGFASTPETDAWLAHYVALGFYYVAMRYHPLAALAAPAAPATTPAPDPASRTAAETMRISFDTPLPYYPYLEPEAAPGDAPRGPRLLDVWLVSRDAFVPVAARRQDGATRWVRPLATGHRYGGENREQLEAALGKDSKILPPGAPLLVQRFTDQKRSRSGFGDVLFVPAQQQALDDAARARLGPLLPTLDARLLEATR